MKVLQGHPQTWERLVEPTSLSVGVYDGVHRGHRALLASAFGHQGVPTVVTFDPHPVEVLARGLSPRLLTTIDERIDLLAEVGAEIVAVIDLADVRYLDPGDFVRSVLIDRLHVATLTVGRDFQFGRDRSGDVAFLRAFGSAEGIEIEVVDLVDVADEPISSSRIRDLVEVGDAAGAAVMLGSRYQMTNMVIDGDKRGREIGFPTANLRPVPRKCLPADGVYATEVKVLGQRYVAATNVGVRPTFGGGERLVEAHILDFDQDIYGQQLTVEFVERLRPELEFDGVEALVARMAQDVSTTRDLLGPVRD